MIHMIPLFFSTKIYCTVVDLGADSRVDIHSREMTYVHDVINGLCAGCWLLLLLVPVIRSIQQQQQTTPIPLVLYVDIICCYRYHNGKSFVVVMVKEAFC